MATPEITSAKVTELLIRWNGGDENALEELAPYVYDQLRRLAAKYLRDERPDHTLQATALVNESFLRLIGSHDVEWKSRAHFIGIAANLMRRVLVDHARERMAQRRGGGLYKLPLSRAERVPLAKDVDLVGLDEALQNLAHDYPRQARVVELLFFGGLSANEAADVLCADGIEVSLRTVERDWGFARAWLFREMKRD